MRLLIIYIIMWISVAAAISVAIYNAFRSVLVVLYNSGVDYANIN